MTFFLLLGALAFLARTVNAEKFEVLPFDDPIDWPIGPGEFKEVGPIDFVLPTTDMVSVRVEGCGGPKIPPYDDTVALSGGGMIIFKNPPHNLVYEEFCAKVILDFGSHPGIATLTIDIAVSANGAGEVNIHCNFVTTAEGKDNTVESGVEKQRTGSVSTEPNCCPNDEGRFLLGDPVNFVITSDQGYYIKVLSVTDGNYNPLGFNPAGDYTQTSLTITIDIPVAAYDLGSIVVKVTVGWQVPPPPIRRRLAEPEPTSGTETTETTLVLGVGDKNSGATHIQIASTLAGAVALLI